MWVRSRCVGRFKVKIQATGINAGYQSMLVEEGRHIIQVNRITDRTTDKPHSLRYNDTANDNNRN